MLYVGRSVPHPRPTLSRLRRDLRRYTTRYGIEHHPTVDRLDDAVTRRRTRMAYLESEIQDRMAEYGRLEREVEGLERGLSLAITARIESIQDEHREAWSPAPVLGFRIWFAADGALHGARAAWPAPAMTARCGRHPGDRFEVPHTDGRCGRLGCGIYATKEPGPLILEHLPASARGWVGGVVALTGKVVEHEHGYRAESAEVVAAAAVGRRERAFLVDPEDLACLFREPQRVVGHATDRRPDDHTDPRQEVIAWLTAERDRRNAWTSVISSG